jgi:large subunit ribosomal protein L10
VERSQKEKLVASLQELFSGSALVVVSHQVGLTVAEATDLRRQMRDAGAVFRVTKNRLARRALDGTPFQHLASLFVGPTAVACSTDPVAAAKVAVKFADDNKKLVILGGALGDQTLDVAGIKTLAALPSLDELRAKIVGMLNTPATRLAAVHQAPPAQLARLFGAYGAEAQAA